MRTPLTPLVWLRAYAIGQNHIHVCWSGPSNSLASCTRLTRRRTSCRLGQRQASPRWSCADVAACWSPLQHTNSPRLPSHQHSVLPRGVSSPRWSCADVAACWSPLQHTNSPRLPSQLVVLAKGPLNVCVCVFLLPISIRFRYLDHLVANRMAPSMCLDPCGWIKMG